MDTVRVIYKQVEDTWTATSPDVPEWTAVANTFDEARTLSEEGVRFALDRSDLIIEHYVPAPV